MTSIFTASNELSLIPLYVGWHVLISGLDKGTDRSVKDQVSHICL
jgi:hypothetical protein